MALLLSARYKCVDTRCWCWCYFSSLLFYIQLWTNDWHTPVATTVCIHIVYKWHLLQWHCDTLSLRVCLCVFVYMYIWPTFLEIVRAHLINTNSPKWPSFTTYTFVIFHLCEWVRVHVMFCTVFYIQKHLDNKTQKSALSLWFAHMHGVVWA